MIFCNFHTYLLVFSLISLNLSIYGQESSKIVQNATDERPNFPNSWVGDWSGTLEIYDAEGLKQQLSMALEIHPIENTSNFTWWIIYGADKEAGKRAYELKPKDPKNGVWQVDEQNSIVLECYFFKDKLFSRYEVADNVFLVTNEVEGDQMIFEVLFGEGEPVSITGGVKDGEEEIPIVKTFPVKGMQRALLKRSE